MSVGVVVDVLSSLSPVVVVDEFVVGGEVGWVVSCSLVEGELLFSLVGTTFVEWDAELMGVDMLAVSASGSRVNVLLSGVGVLDEVGVFGVHDGSGDGGSRCR